MRTTIDIDEDLLETAMRVFDVSTKKEAVEISLREATADRRRKQLATSLGSFHFDLSWDEIHRLREDE